MATERTVLVRLKASVNDFVAGMGTAAAAVKGLSHEINTTNERTAWMAQGFLALAPALVPIGAVAIPAVTTLATQFGLAAAAAGVGILAFQGVGGALKALNTYQLAPTAENLAKMHAEMDKIGPTGENFVRFLDSLTPQLTALKDTAREGLFPGLESGITSLMTRLPEVKDIIGQIATAMGDLAASGGDALAGSKFNDFFDFLQRQARPLLEDMGHTIGNFVDGLAAMASAFEPLTVTFSRGFLSMSQAFASWAHGLSASDSFNNFIVYATDNLPKVADFLSTTAGTFVQLAQAAAPIGSHMLPLLTDMLKIVSAIADTPLGSAFLALAAGVAIFGRMKAIMSITTGGIVSDLLLMDNGLIKTTKAAWAARPALQAFGTAGVGAMTAFGASLSGMGSQVEKTNTGVGAFVGKMAPAAAAVGLLAVAMSDLDDKAGAANATMGALTGLMIGGPIGAGIGAVAGSIIDLTKANDGLDGAVTRANSALQTQSRSALKSVQSQLRSQITDVNDVTGSWKDYFTGIYGYAHSDLAGDIFSKLTGSAGDAKTALEEVNAALAHGTGIPLSGYLSPLVDGLDGVQAKYHEVTQAANDFTRQVDRANRVLDTRGSIRDYQASLDDFTKSVKDNGKTLNITTEKGRNVQGALDGIASSALKAAQNLNPLNQKHFMAQARQDFVGAAMDLGKTRGEARALADRLGLLGKVDAKPTVTLQGMGRLNQNLDELNAHLNAIDHLRPQPTVSVAGVPSALAQIANVRYAMSQLHDKTVFINVARRGGTQVGTNADGNIHDYPAIGDQQPQIRPYTGPAGLTWSEAGSGPWEAFISGHPGKADRSRSIASEVVARLGGRALFANGGMLGGGRSVVAPAPVVNVSGASRDELRMLADMIGDRVARAVKSNGQAGVAASRLGVGP